MTTAWRVDLKEVSFVAGTTRPYPGTQTDKYEALTMAVGRVDRNRQMEIQTGHRRPLWNQGSRPVVERKPERAGLQGLTCNLQSDGDPIP